MSELSDKEKFILEILFKQFDEFLGYFYPLGSSNYDYICRNDIFELAKKLGIDY
jgi:hypothetical protein